MSAVTVQVSGVKQVFFYHLHCKPCVILYSDPLSRMHLISVGMFSLFSAVAQTLDQWIQAAAGMLTYT